MTVTVLELINSAHTNHVKSDFADFETIFYYINNTPKHILSPAIGVQDFAYMHGYGAERFIDNIFNSIDKYIELDFVRSQSKEESNIEIYYLGSFSGGILGLTYSDNSSDGKIDILWESLNEHSYIEGDYMLLKDRDAYTLIHEIGHSLGLSHPNDDPYASWHNSNDTVMSYNFLYDSSKLITKAPKWSNTDIEALKFLWGEETGTPPKNIFLSSENFDEDLIPNSIISNVSTLDDDINQVHSYKLQNNIYDNNNFKIDNNNLIIRESPDYETKPYYTIYLQVSDSDNDHFSKIFNLSVNDRPNATISDDIIIGTSASDLIIALAGDDSIEGKQGNDIIDGGSDYDTYLFSGNYEDYIFTFHDEKVFVNDTRVIQSDGNDTLSNIEKLKFSDTNAIVLGQEIKLINSLGFQSEKVYQGKSDQYKFYDLRSDKYGVGTVNGIDELTGQSILKFDDKVIRLEDDIKAVFDQITGLNDSSGQIFRLYNASFARFPDVNGLNYWIGNFVSGKDTLRAVASSFLASEEFKQRYGENISNEKYVENLYFNVLNREFDQDGYNYWIGNLNQGLEKRYEVLLGFSESIENKNLFSEITGYFE